MISILIKCFNYDFNAYNKFIKLYKCMWICKKIYNYLLNRIGGAKTIDTVVNTFFDKILVGPV